MTKIFPDLSEVIGGCGIRVPVANGSLTDMTINVKRPTTIEEVNSIFEVASKSSLKGILEYTDAFVSEAATQTPQKYYFVSEDQGKTFVPQATLDL